MRRSGRSPVSNGVQFVVDDVFRRSFKSPFEPLFDPLFEPLFELLFKPLFKSFQAIT